VEYVPNACLVRRGSPLGHVLCEGKGCFKKYSKHRTTLLAVQGAPLARAMCFTNDRSNRALRRHPKQDAEWRSSVMLYGRPVAGSFARKPQAISNAVAPAGHGLRAPFLRSALLPNESRTSTVYYREAALQRRMDRTRSHYILLEKDTTKYRHRRLGTKKTP